MSVMISGGTSQAPAGDCHSVEKISTDPWLLICHLSQALAGIWKSSEWDIGLRAAGGQKCHPVCLWKSSEKSLNEIWVWTQLVEGSGEPSRGKEGEGEKRGEGGIAIGITDSHSLNSHILLTFWKGDLDNLKGIERVDILQNRDNREKERADIAMHNILGP